MKELNDAKQIVKFRKGAISRSTFKKILSCLHPDRVDEELKKKYTDAFHAFSDLELFLCNEKEMPTPDINDFPKSYAEALKRKKPKSTKSNSKIRRKI